jgi:plasmid stability protein
MGVSISIKNVPEEKLELLKARAKRNHRSLQGELMALIDHAAAEPPPEQRPVTIDDVLQQGKRLGLSTPDESAAWIRELRDSR